MKNLVLTAVAIFAACSFTACKSAGLETHDAGRWKPYAGCNENQCRSWNSGCQADCMNSQKKIDADTCMNQCRAYFDDCMKSCAAN